MTGFEQSQAYMPANPPVTGQLPPITREFFDAVLFDLDGVLTSTAAIHASAWKRMFDEYLQSLTSRDPAGGDDAQRLRPFEIGTDYKRYVDGKPRSEGVRSFLESRGIQLPFGHPSEEPNDQSVCGLGNRKDAMVKKAIDDGLVESFEGSIEWVRRLRAQGFATAVVSSSRNCGPVLKAAKIDHLFDARVDGLTLEELGLPGKPAPDSFLKAAQLLRVQPRRAVVVEDAISGVEAGRAGKFGLVLGVDREGHGDALRQHGADVVVKDLSELLPAGEKLPNDQAPMTNK